MAFWNRQVTSAMDHAKPSESKMPKPKGWIRWSGLSLVVAGVGLFLLIGYLGITLALKSQLEKSVSNIWGAKVEIGAIDLGVFPLGIGLRDLQVTDPKKPMEILIQIHRIRVAVNLYHWVVGRTVIEEVLLSHLALHQPRQTSGALPKPPPTLAPKVKAVPTGDKKTQNDLAIPLPKMTVPTPQQMLSRESLKTVTIAEDIEQKLAEINQAWLKLEAEIPSQQYLNDYQARFKTLTQGKIDSMQAFEAKKAQFESLKQELEGKQQSLNAAQKTLKNHLPGLQRQVNDLKKAPQQDYQRLLDTYSLDASGLSNISYLLFGPQVQTWINEGIKWARKAEPLIEKFKIWQAEKAQQASNAVAEDAKRFKGQDIHFKEYDPQPDWIIKRIAIEGDVKWGHITAEATQVTLDHPKTQMPILFNVVVKPDNDQPALTLSGQGNAIDPQAPFTEVKVHWPQRQVSDWKILKDRNLPLAMQKAIVDVKGHILLKPQQQIDAWLNLDYQQVDMQIVDSPSKDVNRYLAPLFSDIDAFKVTTEVTGDWYAPKIGANSDLDKILSGAFDQLLTQELSKLKTDLKAQLDAELAKQLQPIQKQLSVWLDKDSQLALQQKGIGQILNSNWQANAKKALQQRLDAEVTKAKQQAQAKIDAEKAKLDQARKDAEAKAKAELEAQKKAAEKKAKQEAEKAVGDQVKKLFKF